MEYSGFIRLFCVLSATTVLQSSLTGSVRLDPYIQHYESLNYNTADLHDSHLRHKRSVQDHVALDIDAFGRNLKLKLKRDNTVFADDFVLDIGGQIQRPDLSFIYSGKLEGDPASRVHGAIINGVFSGEIHVPKDEEVYHVEKSSSFFDKHPGFHSVIYKETQMDLDPFRERREREKREASSLGSCGNLDSREWMRQVVASEVREESRAKRYTQEEWQGVYKGDDSSKYLREMNSAQQLHQRKRRATLGKKNSCFMSLMADSFLYRHYLLKANNNTDIARDEVLAFFASHVNAINKIYGDTSFTTYATSSDQLSYSGVRFTVQKTKIQTPAECSNPGSANNPRSANLTMFCAPNIDVSNFLNMNSLLNHDDFCLAYIFTYRDFSKGTLGLAWVGASNAASGGVCERNKRFTEGSSQVYKSLNTGVVTKVNYGTPVPSKVSQLTFAHEVGHNFGSPHDSGAECAPYNTGRSDASEGNYIMFASATMGDKPHNNEFSLCSKDNITRVLHAVLNSPSKYNCFKEAGPFCGNGIVEDGEECDCGYADDCTDQCCNAKQSQPNNPDMECKLKAGKQCSPTQGPCCTTQCSFIGATENHTCRYKQECSAAAFCNGSTALCPVSTPEANGAYCANYGFTCQGGECAGSLCEKFGWTECFVTGPSKTKKEQETLCKLGCRQNGTSDCILSSDTDKLTKYTAYKTMIDDVLAGRDSNMQDGVELAPGSPCNNFQGYCDVFHRCRGVDAEGPLARLKNLIFDPQTLEDISNWIVEKWWAVLLISIGLILSMALFINFCAVHTPSSNPKAKPARKLSETMTLRRRRNQNRPPPQQPEPVRYPQKERGYRDRDARQYRNPQGPPPPYPGSSSSASHQGPRHGHGKGKGRRSKDIEMGRV